MKISDKSSIYFVSDTHFGHANVIKYSNRPFKSAEEMDRALIDNWNSVVKPNDVVFHLGDFAFCDTDVMKKITSRLNGTIHLMLGNHDKAIRNNKDQIRKKFGSVQDVLEIKVADDDALRGGYQSIFLSHYAHRVWNKSHYGSWNLFGHSHGSLKIIDTILQMDVGVDATGGIYSPVSYYYVKNVMKSKCWKPIDHHGSGK